MRTTRNSLIASAVAATLTATLTLAPAANAQESVLSSAFQSSVSGALDRVGLVGDTERGLRDATEEHLSEMGHTPHQEAERIAAAWVTEATLGHVDFVSGAGKGTFGADRGEGQVYRLTEQAAEDRIAWLDREANPATATYDFGTAVLNDTRGNVYLAEFFLGA